jgi:hypothetical protein
MWLTTGTGGDSNEPSGSIKGGEFFDELSILLLASQKGVSTMALVTE